MSEPIIEEVTTALTAKEKEDLTDLCARCLFGTLFKAVEMLEGGRHVL